MIFDGAGITSGLSGITSVCSGITSVCSGTIPVISWNDFSMLGKRFSICGNKFSTSWNRISLSKRVCQNFSVNDFSNFFSSMIMEFLNSSWFCTIRSGKVDLYFFTTYNTFNRKIDNVIFC